VDDAIAAAEGEAPLEADEAVWLEIVGYRTAMTYVLQIADDENLEVDEGLLKSLHFMMLKHDLKKNPGRWRPGPGAEAKVETRKVFNAERKALQVMGLGADATLQTVKAKYKALVKQHHPDANGGDRSTEDRLIEIIKAYNYLKTVVRA